MFYKSTKLPLMSYYCADLKRHNNNYKYVLTFGELKEI